VSAERISRRTALVVDVVAAAVVIGGFWLPPVAQATGWRVPAAAALVPVIGAAMVLRRRFPLAATVLAAVTTLGAAGLGVALDPMLATAWCLYPLAVALAARTLPIVVVLACGVLGLVVVTGVGGGGSGRLVLAVAALVIAWLLGTAVGRQLVAAREAERARVQLEVARDIHDVVGHALGVISAEASVTRSLPDADEAEMRNTLGEIETLARQALQEVQALVRGLRDRDPADLASVIDGARRAGLAVEASVDVGPEVGEGVRIVVLRIVQEALNNVLRHAPGAACSVAVGRAGKEVVVRVRDSGSKTPGTGAGSGLGLRGMRERALLVGGTVSWERPAGGGFEVLARLPLRADR
jgi:signal transduction histidine kinase